MKLKINIREVAESRGIKTAYRLKKKVGLSPSNANKIYNHKFTQISISTLGKLCEALECEPSDLFVLQKSSIKKKRFEQDI